MWRLRQVRNTKFGTNASNKMLLNSVTRKRDADIANEKKKKEK